MALTIWEHIEAAKRIIKDTRSKTSDTSPQAKKAIGLLEARLEIIRGMIPNEEDDGGNNVLDMLDQETRTADYLLVERDDLKDENAWLVERLDDANGRRLAAESELKVAVNEMEAGTSEILKLRERIHVLEELVKADGDINDLQEQNAEFERTNLALRDCNKYLQDRNGQLIERNVKLEAFRRAGASSLQVMTGEVQQLVAERDELQQLHRKALKHFEDQRNRAKDLEGKLVEVLEANKKLREDFERRLGATFGDGQVRPRYFHSFSNGDELRDYSTDATFRISLEVFGEDGQARDNFLEKNQEVQECFIAWFNKWRSGSWSYDEGKIVRIS